MADHDRSSSNADIGGEDNGGFVLADRDDPVRVAAGVGHLGWWGGRDGLAVVFAPEPPVLVGDDPPAPVGRWPVGGDGDGVVWVEVVAEHGAAMREAVAEVEDVGELLPGL